MQKIYLLLRNNRQSGPYSLAELVALQLRPLDLVWIEGKSRSWAYPTELPELKEYVEEDKNTKESVTVYPQASTDLVLPRTNNKAKNEQPEDKINVQVYVKLPHESEAERFFSDNNPLLQGDTGQAPGRARGPVVQQADGLLNTKYTRDLQEIKEEYTAWIGQRKQTEVSRQQNKPWLIWAIIAFLGMAGFLSERWSSSGSAAQMTKLDTLAKKSITVSQPKSSKSKKGSRSITKNDKAKKTAAITKSAEEKIKEEKVKEEKKPEDSSKAGALPAVTKRPVKPDPQALLNLLYISYTSDTASHSGIHDLMFTIHNRSEQKLNTVALDVYYNNGEGQMLIKETIHFNNIEAGGAVSEPAPANEQAVKIHYQVALINTDEVTYNRKSEQAGR